MEVITSLLMIILDLAMLGDYYTNGSYGFRIENNYNKRYKFRGNFSFRYENLINSERGLPGYNKSTIFNLRWSHSKDSKSNPNSRFSSSVNLGTSSYFRESLNQINTTNFLNNTLSSSISYSRTFPKYPSVNLSLSATHSQNTRTKSVNMTLPSLTASMERIYPFVKRNAVKKEYFKILIFNIQCAETIELILMMKQFPKRDYFMEQNPVFNLQYSISTNFKIAKHFNFSLGRNYSEVWTNQTIRKFDYDLLSRSVPAQDTINGFDRFTKYNYSASVGTTLYGVFNFNKQNRLQSIRHVLNTSVSYSNQPGFEKYYDEYIIDAFGNTRTYSRFDGGLYGTPGNRKSSSVGITLRNTVEAKVKDDEKNDDEDFKKIKILNNLNFTTNYNIVADSLNWSPVRMSTVVPLFDNKLSLNIGATFDPYALNEEKNRKINKFSINNNGPLFRMTSANMNWGYNFSSKNNKNKERNQQSNIPGMNIKKGLDEDRNSFIKPPELEDKKEEEKY